ncbi:MAG: prolipoprotein diacylglyceryl transferase family protein, partial [Chloroflexota bacterium]
MLTVSIDPVILSIGHFHVRWYSLIVLLAVVVGLWLVMRATQKKGFTKEAVQDLVVWVILSGLIGARLFHVID